MDLDSQNQHENHDENRDNVPVKKSLLKSVSGTALKISAFGILSLILVGGGALYLGRIAISQGAIKNFMTSKGVASDVKIDKLGLGGAHFSVLSVGTKGQETLLARNGYLKWHYSFSEGKLILDDFRADSVNINLGLDKNGLDLRDFKKFITSDGKNDKNQKALIAIDAINAENININFATPYGNIANHAAARGNRKSGFVISVRTILPQKIDPTGNPIGIGIATGNMTLSRINLGAAIKVSGNDFAADDFVKSLRIKGLKANLALKATSNQDFDKINFAFAPSQILIADLRAEGVVLNNALGVIDKFNWQSGKEPLKDAIIAAAGKFNLSAGNIGGNAIGASNLAFDMSRAGGGKTALDATLNATNLKSSMGGGNLIIKSHSDFILDDLQKFNPDNLSSQIALNGNNISGAAIDDILKSARGAGLSIGNLIELDVQLLLEKKGDKIAIYLDKPILLSDNAKTRLIFEDAGTRVSAFNLERRGNAWFSSLIAKGRIGLSAGFGQIVSEIKGINIAAGTTNIAIGQSVFHNFRISDFTLNGGLDGATFQSIEGARPQANLSGNIVAQSAKYALAPSRFRFDGRMNGDNFAFSADGNVKKFDSGDLRLTDTNLNLNGAAVMARGKIGTISGNLRANAAQGLLSREYALKNTVVAAPFALSFNNDGMRLISDNIAFDAASLNSGSIKSGALKLRGALSADIKGNNMAFNSPHCLDINLHDFAANDYYLDNARGHLCPDNGGRLAILNNGNLNLLARTEIDGGNVQMGRGEDAQTLSFGGLEGAFSGGKGGEIIYNGNVRTLSLRLKTGDNQYGNFNASNANIKMSSKGGITNISGTLSQISAQNMPMMLDGAANADLSIAQNGAMSGKFTFKDLHVKDSEKDKRFSDMSLSGSGNLKNNHLFLQGSVNHELSSNLIATFYVNHELNSGDGSADINVTALQFYAYNNTDHKPKFGIEDLVPTMRGFFVDTWGSVNGDARFEWAKDKPLKSRAVVSTSDLNFKTVPAQFYGVAGNLVFDDLLNLKTAPHQEIRVRELNPGIPLENGILTFSFDGDNAINIISAEWPFADGKLRLNPAKIDFTQGDKFLTIAADNIDIAKLLLLTKVPNFEVQGRMSGILPIRMVDNDVEIIAGQLNADEKGGILRYVGPDVSGTQPQTPGKIEALKQKVTGKPPPQGAELAIQALRNLHYKVLSMDVNGRITGDMKFNLLIEGNNPDLLSGAGFRFRVGLAAPVGSLRKFYQNAFEFDTNTVKRKSDGTYEYVPTMGTDNGGTNTPK